MLTIGFEVDPKRVQLYKELEREEIKRFKAFAFLKKARVLGND